MAEALLASRSAGYLPRALALIDEWLEDHPPTLAGWWAWVEDGADDRSPYTLSQYTAMMRTAARLFRPTLLAVLQDPRVDAALAGLRNRAGPRALLRGATPLPQQLAVHLARSSQPPWSQVFILLWARGARVADVAALREGSLWRVAPDVLGVELAGTKGQRMGLPTGLELTLPPWAMAELAPITAPTPPRTPANDRPQLFPWLSAPVVTAELRRRLGPSTVYTAHSFRKGAVPHLMGRGASAAEIAVLTQHRTLAGLSPYARRPDDATRAVLRSTTQSLWD